MRSRLLQAQVALRRATHIDPEVLLGRWCHPGMSRTCDPHLKGRQADDDNGAHAPGPAAAAQPDKKKSGREGGKAAARVSTDASP